MGEPFQLGRYTLYAELASGGMATVYLARLNGAVGFGRTVAIKRLHPHLSRNPDFCTMFLDEARLAARVQHPNVVPTLDVVANEQELFLVLEYVRGETLSGLLRATVRAESFVPVPVVLSIVGGALSGLHAAHEAKDEQGHALNIVHRDVSPQNIIVGADGVARVLDFGVAKAASRLQTTREGQIKGKMPYMAPEQFSGVTTRQTDVYAAGIVLWETLTRRRLFAGETEAEVLAKVLRLEVPPPSSINPEVPAELDRIVGIALARDPAYRYRTAREMALDVEDCMRPASATQVSEWMQGIAGPVLEARSQLVSEIESGGGSLEARPPSGPATELPSTVSVASHTVSHRPPKQTSRSRVVVGVLGATCAVVALAVAFRMGASSRDHPGAASNAKPDPAMNLPVATRSPPATPPEVSVETLPVASSSPTTAASATARDGKPKVRPRTQPPRVAPGSSSDLNSLLDTH